MTPQRFPPVNRSAVLTSPSPAVELCAELPLGAPSFCAVRVSRTERPNRAIWLTETWIRKLAYHRFCVARPVQIKGAWWKSFFLGFFALVPVARLLRAAGVEPPSEGEEYPYGALAVELDDGAHMRLSGPGHRAAKW